MLRILGSSKFSSKIKALGFLEGKREGSELREINLWVPNFAEGQGGTLAC